MINNQMLRLTNNNNQNQVKYYKNITKKHLKHHLPHKNLSKVLNSAN